jgi:hypothetical protein
MTKGLVVMEILLMEEWHGEGHYNNKQAIIIVLQAIHKSPTG